MNKYHLFFDDNLQAIVIEDDPKALDAAPYERMTIRRGLADALTADFWLRANGGVAVYADGRTVEVQAI